MKLKSMLAVIAAVLMTMMVMAGCNNDKDNGTSSGNGSGLMSDIESSVSDIGSDITSGTESLTSEVESNVTDGSQTAVTGKLKEAYEAVKQAFGEDYVPNMSYDEAYVNDRFGISEDMVKQVIAEGPMISVNVDTFIGVEAAQGEAADVEKALQEYAQMLNSQSLQYSMNAAKVKAAQVKRFGDYVFFVMLGVADNSVLDLDEAGQLEFSRSENQKALDAIAGVFEP